MNPHDERLSLEAMVRGELSEAEALKLSEHVSECDACLAQLDQLWESSFRIPETEAPTLEPQQAKRMERQLMRDLHRQALSANMIWLATKGLLNVILTLIKPFFSWMAYRSSSSPAAKESKS